MIASEINWTRESFCNNLLVVYRWEWEERWKQLEEDGWEFVAYTHFQRDGIPSRVELRRIFCLL